VVLKRFETIDKGIQSVLLQGEHIRNAMEEQGIGSKQILEAIAELNEITNLVKDGSAEMLSESKGLIGESKTLERISLEITNGMNEMSSGAEQINTAVSRVTIISGENKSTIEDLMQEVSKFKINGYSNLTKD
jgi:methyl-accepting chemotaxis protein